MKKVQQVGGIIDFGGYILNDKLNPSKLFVRPCYKDLWSQICSDNRHYMIQGSPGIGKSLFAAYLLWQFAHFNGPPYIVWAIKSCGFAVVFSMQEEECLKLKLEDIVEWLLFNKSKQGNTIILVDGIDPPIGLARCIVTTSPNSAPKVEKQKFELR